MKIAIPCDEKSLSAQMSPQFGRAAFYAIYDLDTKTATFINNSQTLNTPSGAGIQAARHIVDAGVNALLSGHCGPKAFRALQSAGVSVFTGLAGTVQETVDKYNSGTLKSATNADVEGHWV